MPEQNAANFHKQDEEQPPIRYSRAQLLRLRGKAGNFLSEKAKTHLKLYSFYRSCPSDQQVTSASNSEQRPLSYSQIRRLLCAKPRLRLPKQMMKRLKMYELFRNAKLSALPSENSSVITKPTKEQPVNEAKLKEPVDLKEASGSLPKSTGVTKTAMDCLLERRFFALSKVSCPR